MPKVEFRLEIGDRKRSPDAFIKNVVMPAAPVVGLQISEVDVVLTIARLQYDIPTETYYALIIERDSEKSEWQFMENNGWKLTTARRKPS